MYIQRKGVPAKELSENFPALHRLLVDKWRVDELYDELVVGSLEALAEASVWIDRWVVDGVIARVTSLLVSVWGHLLRLFHTGHVQVYAAAMVGGLFVMGWFFAVPQTRAVVTGDASSGRYSVRAAPGLGYEYKWDADGDGEYDTEEFGSEMHQSVQLEPGASREVKLQVRNVFGRVRAKVFTVQRPRRDGSAPTASVVTPALRPTLQANLQGGAL
jgi:NADH-quinone oxidoreductase subunit L